MLFDTMEYLVFFTVFCVIYYSVKSELTKKTVLLIGSYVFYMSYSAQYGILLLVCTIVSYTLAGVISKTEHTTLKKAYLSLAVVFALSPLVFFKYWDFLCANAFFLSPARRGLLAHHLLLPIGISFFTFNILSYLIDSYKGKIQGDRDVTLLDYAVYVSFFPSLLAGPLIRATDFLPQLRSRSKIQGQMIWEGLVLIFIGYLKKVVFSDNLAIHVNKLFDNPSGYGGPELLVGAYAFAIQIYCDFSGYTDIARGTALLFGYNLPINFNFPYLAKNPSDFWGRWHISLSSWFRDYVYFPLGGNRRGMARTFLNLFSVMLLCGLWHGASWHFVLWGIFHGSLLIVYRYFDVFRLTVKPYVVNLVPEDIIRFTSPIRHLISIIVMFHLVVVGWIIFKADSLTKAAEYMRGIVTASGYRNMVPSFLPDQQFVLVTMLLFVLYHLFSTPLNLKARLNRHLYSPYVLTLFIVLLLIMSAFRVDQSVQFIYFQF